jgi:F-type H+-transporting ATPase subunit alpha
MRDYIKSKYAELIKRIDEKGDLSADDEKALKDAIADWKKNGTF